MAFDDKDFERFKSKQVPAPPTGVSQGFNNQAFEAYKAKQGKQDPTRLPIGSVAGSIALPLAFSGVGTPAAIGLGVLGAMGGEATQRMVEKRLGIGPPPMPPKEELKNIATQGAYQLGGDVLGRGVGAVASKVLSPFGKTVTPEGKDAIAFLSQRGMPSPQLLPAEATSSRALDFLHNIAEHGFGGMGMMARYKEGRDYMLKRMQSDMLDTMARKATPDEAARLLIQSAKGNFEMAQQPAEFIYKALTKATGPTPIVSIRGVKAQLAPMLQMAEQTKGLEDRAMGASLLEYIQGLPDVVDYAAAQQIRTKVRAFQEMLQKSVETKNAPGIGVAKTVYGNLTNAIEQGLQKNDPFLAKMWKDANFIERGAQLQYNTKAIRQLFQKASELGKSDPSAVVKALQSAGPEPIKVIRNAVGPSEWSSFQRVALEGMMMKSGFGTAEGLQGKQWLDAMFGGGPSAREKMKAIFDPHIIQNLERFGNALQTLQSKQGAKEGSMWIQLTQAGQLAGAGAAMMGSGTIKPIGYAVLTTPPVLAYIMTRPHLSKWFIEGIQAPAWGQQANSLLGKVLAAIPQTLYSAPQYQPSQPETSPTGTIRPFPLQK